MSTNGILDFQNTNKIIFRGSDSNVVIDTSNVSLGIGIQGTEIPGSNLHVVGDAYISSNLKLTTDTSILVNSNVVTNFSGPHARLPKEVPLKKYPEIAFDASKADVFGNSNAYAQAGYEISSTSRYETGVAIDANDIKFAFDGRGDENGSAATPSTLYPHYASQSSSYSTSNPFAYTLFTNNVTDKDGVNYSGEEIKLKLPNKIKLSKLNIVSFSNSGDRQARNGHIFGSNTGANGSWTKIIDFTNLNSVGGSSVGTKSVSVSTVEYFEWYSLVITHLADSGGLLNLRELEYYGTEENPPAGDTSVDTTFTSIMNTPQTTGANVYVDAKLSSDFTNQVTGPTPVGTAAVHDNTNKYWELNGQLTSNVTLEANTFLEGDQPHAVSVWFNSSNLEANTANTCVFSVSDQEKLDSVNLDLQSNTWHNLTYAYQGEGGSRVAYLDGRKVAEDQAEDTFGDYPPFAMAGYSQGGYVVSADSEHSSTAWFAYEAFSKITSGSNGHLSVDNNYYNDGSGGYTRSPPATIGVLASTGATINEGDWLKIEMPNKIIVDYISQISLSDRPKDFKWYGSNDDYNWTQLLSVVDAPNNTNTNSFIATTRDAFRYFALVVSRVYSYPSLQYWRLDDVRLYGHRENDLVRLPDPTNVLKYPHVVMTGPAQRGYVAKVSSQTSTTVDYPHIIFDGDDTTQFRSALNTYTSGTANTTDNLKTQTSAGGTATINGSWISIELPHKLILQSTRVVSSDGTSHVPKRLIIYGSNDITNDGWVEVDTTYKSVDANIPYQGTGKTWTTTSSSTGYKNFALAVSQIESTGNNRLVVSTWELYGTGVDSIPIQIGGGNIDKVANFRVYDKFVGEDQALEIWDAQKDEFGRAKSSMTLQKGRLGIGTTEPQGRLAVLDEPHNLEEFPPRAMQSSKVSIDAKTDYYDTHFEGHGTFTAYGSHQYVQPNDARVAWKSFSKQTGGNSTSFGYMNSGNHYSSGGNIYTGPESNGGKSGDFLGLKFPYKVKITHFFVMSYVTSTSSRGPKEGYLLGRINGGDWQQVHFFQNKIFEALEYTKFEFENDTFYDEYILVVTKTTGATVWNASELRYFGTREQGQSVLHDGQLTLTKSLNVPRIGPALDADDTPRRDRLVVEYNTLTNPTFEGTVRDTSGRGNDGFMVGSSYDSIDKSLSFTNSATGTSSAATSYITRQSLGNKESGNFHHSVSLWFKMATGVNSAYRTIFEIGPNPRVNTKDIALYVTNNSANPFGFASGGNTLFSTTPLTSSRGHLGAESIFHIVVVYDGVKKYMYINGVLNNSAAYTSFNGVQNMTMQIGRNNVSGAGNEGIDGSISNFKMYVGHALTTEEVKTLYDMGRCDEGHHMVNFSKTRVGIGLGDGNYQGRSDYRGVLKPHLNVGGLIHGSAIRFPREGLSEYNAYSQYKYHMYFEDGRHMSIFYDGTDLEFSWTGGGTREVRASVGNSAEFGFSFTGQHRNFIKDISYKEVIDKQMGGLIVCANNNEYVKISGGIEKGSNAVTQNEALPIVSLSVKALDKSCFGVISESEDPNSNRGGSLGMFKSYYDTEKGDTRVIINSIGEGAIWVVDTNGPLESGDYITTSNVAGYGQKQDSEFLANYSVAKITMDCDFTGSNVAVQTIKREETGTRIITEDAWNQLVEYDRYSNVEDEITTYYQIQRGENVLDDNGQLQFEDKTGATEAPYERRFLTTDGTQTDEANAVHIASFVGCTYHCG